MESITLADLDAEADRFDAHAAATPAIDTFCSSSAWALSAAGTLSPEPDVHIARGVHGYLATQRAIHADGFTYLAPLEMMWGLASPLVGADATALVAEVVTHLALRADWHVALWPGLSASGPQLRALARLRPPGWDLRLGPPTVRHVASLDGGVDGFLSRRSPNLRRALRKATRAATAAGVELESVIASTALEAEALFARIIAVEDRSWKAREDVGLREGAFRDFYRHMMPRLAVHRRQRTVFARLDGRDIAYCLGAVFAGGYRGLQFSYDDAHAALSLGSLCQLHQIGELVAEGVATYDLGTDMDYKRRWAEGMFETRLVIVVRR